MVLGFDQRKRREHDKQQQREKLLQQLEVEQARFKEIVKEYYSAPKRDQSQWLMAVEAIISGSERILATTDWEESLFLRNLLKPLKALQQQASEFRNQLLAEEEVRAGRSMVLSAEQRVVYISLYQAMPGDLRQWERLLATLPNYVQGRPVYASREDVQKAIRSTPYPERQAFVVVAIDQEDWLESEEGRKTRVDRLGLPLVALESRAVKITNIMEFSYQGQRYLFREGRLVKIEDNQ